ncbi:inositol monophosphatase [Pistricoccus aurantiacus]|uniref:Inositol-1-monophosphatase n=1 Tax=Pistricoccus aurantiacus TaxID=1883414 RepID=A0A5B8SS23_9GAMM|nr:inositol monophosphatase family protein [Pistricoccus aurantiacus]QEA39919.1 inositol monophosphatase [Pistricoccus aurantiacus]
MPHAERLAIAIEIAREAGRAIVEARRNQDFSHRYKKGSELVTDVDVAVDELIARRLDEQFGDEPRLTEELSPDESITDQQGPLWIIDPIDGTVNFAHGLSHVAVSIAWMKDGHTELGVVHAPFLGETFSALRGGGAWRHDESGKDRQGENPQRIRVSCATSLARALVATGFPYRREGRAPLIRRLYHVLEHCQDLRRNGSAALDLCDVACGRLDAYYESVSPWDFAAGMLIAREAGARTGHLYDCPTGIPTDLYGENVIACAPDLYQRLSELLIRADTDSRDGQ